MYGRRCSCSIVTSLLTPFYLGERVYVMSLLLTPPRSQLASTLKKHQAGPPGDIIDLYMKEDKLHMLVNSKLTAIPLSTPFKLDTSSESTFTARLLSTSPTETMLQLITDCGAHGTHVACISAGVDGVCPGAMVESYRVGDQRLGSMETTRSIAMALSHLKGDVVNMSYGEAVSTVGKGYLMPIIDEVRRPRATSGSDVGLLLTPLAAILNTALPAR